MFSLCFLAVFSALSEPSVSETAQATATDERSIPWTLGAATLRGDGVRQNRVGLSESMGAGYSAEAPGLSVMSHAIDLQVSVHRSLDLSVGLRVVHTFIAFIPEFEPRLGFQAQLYNKNGLAFGVLVQTSLRASIFFPLQVRPEATFTLSARVSDSSPFTLDTSLGLRATTQPASQLTKAQAILLPTVGFGFTYHWPVRTLFVRCEYAPLFIVAERNAAWPLGSAWISLGGSWTYR